MARTIALIQARVSSTRLPAKCFADIAGRPLLWHVYQRTARAKGIDQTIIATSFSEADRELVQWCHAENIPIARGGADEDDVLGRFWDVATEAQASMIVRVCGDSPLLDTAEIERVVAKAKSPSGHYDYVGNAEPGKETLPDGMDCEAIAYKALTAANRAATLPADREHVTPWLQREMQRRAYIGSEHGNYGHLRFCVDDEADLRFVRAVYEALGRDDFGWRDVVKLMGERLEIAALMGTATRNATMETH